MKLFDGYNFNDTYNNFILSKNSYLLKPNLSFKELNIQLDVRYTFKTLDETLLVFWLFYILNNNKFPMVKFSKFNKKLCFMILKNISLNSLNIILEDFSYNVRYTSLKKKKVRYISDHKLLYTYTKKLNPYFFCYFSSVFKQNNLEHIFHDLGVSGLKLFFKLSLSPDKYVLSSDENMKLYKDIIELSNFEYNVKNFMFEEVTVY